MRRCTELEAAHDEPDAASIFPENTKALCLILHNPKGEPVGKSNLDCSLESLVESRVNIHYEDGQTLKLGKTLKLFSPRRETGLQKESLPHCPG